MVASATIVQPQPQSNTAVIQEAPPNENIFAVLWRNYFVQLDNMFRTAQYGPLTNAANDSAAAAAGVPVNGMYRNGSVVMIRVT